MYSRDCCCCFAPPPHHIYQPCKFLNSELVLSLKIIIQEHLNHAANSLYLSQSQKNYRHALTIYPGTVVSKLEESTPDRTLTPISKEQGY